MVQAFLPIHFKNIGIVDSFIGFLIGIFSASYLLLVLPAGLLSDRFGIINLTRIGIILFFIYIAGLTHASSTFFLILLIVIGGMGAAIVTVSLTTMFYKRFLSVKRGRNIGIFTLGSAAGYSLGPLVAGLLLPTFGMTGVFIASLCSIFFLFIISFGIKIDNPNTFVYMPSLAARKRLFHKTIGRWDFIILVFSTIVFSSHLGMEQSTLSLFLEESLLISLPSIGTLYACLGIWIGLNTFFFGRLFDRIQNILPFILFGTICSGVFHILTVTVNGYWDFLFIRLIHTIGDASIILINGVMTSIVFKDEVMGEGVGSIFGLRMAVIFLSATICGFLNGIYGYRINFLTTGVLYIAFGIFIFINRGKVKNAFKFLPHTTS